MWLSRLTAVGALAIVSVLFAVLTLRSPAPDAARSAAPTPTAKPRKAHRGKKKAAVPVVGEITGAKARAMAVPILMYHVIAKAPAGVANAELWVDEDVFADEMRALDAAGYTAITLQQAWDGWQRGGPLPRKPIVISFDDGYLSHYTHAKPVLRKLGWPGVLYLTTKSIGPGGLTEHQIRSLIKAGWELDSHTLTHPDLTTLDDATLARELEDSRALLRERFGVPVNFFAYPASRNDARVRTATEAAGYLAATTVEEGVARGGDDPFALKRVRVNATDTAESLLTRLAGPRG
ncbi:polysaccharide deacetylase family protein [Solirubrobacter phytolaccae]|uniref:Polysaccharide deacetylase family protein n=1 Tax=Solirubrobacter phytolaccae TaxID=1404360 RepID=A0A9X3NI58_9ACTN|nr:polysaccharide deacetylase family protein [Solirubrobacter phytolaccae]MDA0181677.1 polysaccharide deacetylase family protein [Solirubrobacter phytolaccae]